MYTFSDILRVNSSSEWIEINSPVEVKKSVKFDLQDIFRFVDTNFELLSRSVNQIIEEVGSYQDELVLKFLSSWDNLKTKDDDSSRCWKDLQEIISNELPRLQEDGYHTLETIIGLIVLYISQKIPSIELCNPVVSP